MTPFVIFALPRSRTYWLSHFLSYQGWICGHDEARHVRSVDDVRSWLAMPAAGTVETAASPFWRLLLQERPDARVVVVRRPVAEVIDSLSRVGVVFDLDILTRNMIRLDRKLDIIERRFPGALSVRYEDLTLEATCKTVFEHCLPFQHNHDRWKQLAALNLQTSVPALLRYEAAHAPQLRRAEQLVVQQIRTTIRSARVRTGAPDERGVTIQQEGIGTFRRDAAGLFAEHCAAVGEPSDQWSRKNMKMLDFLDATNCLHIVTARCNGRVLAYLMTVIGPSLEDANRISGTQTIFFASEDAAGMGLGMTLQKASLAMLKQHGVEEVIMRAGVRGTGPRLGALYRRLGAEAFGNLYRLDLKAA